MQCTILAVWPGVRGHRMLWRSWATMLTLSSRCAAAAMPCTAVSYARLRFCASPCCTAARTPPPHMACPAPPRVCHAWEVGHCAARRAELRPRLPLHGCRGASSASHFTYLTLTLSMSIYRCDVVDDPSRSDEGMRLCPACPLVDASRSRSVWPLQFTRVASSPTSHHLGARICTATLSRSRLS